MELLVVGAGTMGRWVARTLDGAVAPDSRGSGDVEVAFADVDPDAAEAAAAELDARAVPLDGDESFDVVCLAVPMSVVPEAAARQVPRAREAAFDVAGEMAGPLDALREHGPELERASLHPLFAPENAPGNVAVVRDRDGPTIEAVLERVAAAGNEIVETTPEEHDRAMESVQAAAHAAIVAYGLASEQVPEGFATPVSAALDDLVEQVTGGDAAVYGEIQDAFEGAAAVASAADRVDAADGEELARLLDEASPAAPPADRLAGSSADDGDEDARGGPADPPDAEDA